MSDRIINALTGATKRPYYMPPGILGTGGNVPEGAHVSDSGEVGAVSNLRPDGMSDFTPYPVVRRPGGLFPLTRGPDGEPIVAMPRGLDMLGLVGPVLGGTGGAATLGSRAMPRGRVAEALAAEPLRVVGGVPARTPGASKETLGFDILRGEKPIGYSDVERIGPGQHKFSWMGAGEPGAQSISSQHFAGSLGTVGQRDVLRQIRQFLQEKHPNDPWPTMHDTLRESGANPGRTINDWKLPLVVGGVPTMLFPQQEDR